MFKRNIFKILAVAFFLLSGASFYNSTKIIPKKVSENKQVIKKILYPTKIPVSTTSIVKLTITEQKKLSPTVIALSQIIILPMNTPVPQTISQPTNPPQQDKIILEINEPDGNNKFTLTYKDGTNPCSILNDAKNDGKIKSITITHYGAPLNSDYVKEINGFSDNWNFAIDDSGKPKGCSNYILNKNSTVTWKYN